MSPELVHSPRASKLISASFLSNCSQLSSSVNMITGIIVRTSASVRLWFTRTQSVINKKSDQKVAIRFFNLTSILVMLWGFDTNLIQAGNQTTFVLHATAGRTNIRSDPTTTSRDHGLCGYNPSKLKPHLTSKSLGSCRNLLTRGWTRGAISPLKCIGENIWTT